MNMLGFLYKESLTVSSRCGGYVVRAMGVDMPKLEAAVGFLVARSSRELDRLATAVKIRWRSRPNAPAARANKIFIAGCARSGTTLTQRVMKSFEDTFVWPPEARQG